ncbi:MAG TPA: hypothetical protein VK625_20980, partial [Flavitalea sp.]|nr:hypothetical protein [Flavitalea sp.]
MKSYLLVASLLVLLMTNLFAEVKNGYERDMPGLRASLKCLRDMISNEQHLSNAQKRNIKARIRQLVDYMVYYEITDTLLRQFRTIAPELYGQMDTLKNCKGKIVDVYVKFIPKQGAKFPGAGMASFSPTFDDLNTCSSE